PATRPDGVFDLPRLPEEEKNAACAGALAVCQPSTNESFSIVLMEAWLHATPVLVNAACPVTHHHVTVADGGLSFNDATEFAAEVRYLRRHPEEARELGRQGRAYVLENYSWERVIDRFETGLVRVLEGS
ncbi:MAG: glycosyltransferase, partial [Candidatus Binatia bacterium]